MSRRKDNRSESSSGVGLLAGAIGVGIGLLAGFVYNKLTSSESQKQRVVVENRRMHPQRDISPQTHLPNDNRARDQHFEETMVCPISLEIMQDPVTIPECGHSFDRSTITPILNKKSLCPLCRKQTEVGRLVPNYQLKNVIQHYKETRR